MIVKKKLNRRNFFLTFVQRNFEQKKRGAPQRLRLRGWDLDPALRAQRPQGMAKTAPLQSTMLRSAPLFSLKISLQKAGVKRPQFISTPLNGRTLCPTVYHAMLGLPARPRRGARRARERAPTPWRIHAPRRRRPISSEGARRHRTSGMRR